jgi:hypothetical protein
MDGERTGQADPAEQKVVHTGPSNQYVLPYFPLISLILLLILSPFMWADFTAGRYLSGALNMFFPALLLLIYLRGSYVQARGRPFLKLTPPGLIYSEISEHLILPWHKMDDARVVKVSEPLGDGDFRDVLHFKAIYCNPAPAPGEYGGRTGTEASKVALDISLDGFALKEQKLGNLLQEYARRQGGNRPDY